MQINFGNKILKTVSPKSGEIRANSPIYSKTLNKDVFEKSAQIAQNEISFSGSKYINRYDMAYSNTRVKDPAYYLKYTSGETDRIKNISSKRFAQKLLPAAMDILQKDTLEDGKTVYEVMLDKKDELKNIQDKTFEYVNQKVKASPDELTGKELAVLLLAKNEKTKGGEVINALNILKENKSGEEYNKFMEDYIKNPNTDIIQTIKNITKPMDEELQEKFNNIQDLLDENPNQNLISYNREKLRLAANTKAIKNLSDLEFGFYVTLNKNHSPRKIGIVDVKDRLEKIKPHVPDEIYNQVLEKCCKGEINTNKLYQTLFDIKPRSTHFRNFTDDDWTGYTINMMHELSAQNQK